MSLKKILPVRNFTGGKNVLAVVDSAEQYSEEDPAVVADLVAAELAQLLQDGVQVHGDRHGAGRRRASAANCERVARPAAETRRHLSRY